MIKTLVQSVFGSAGTDPIIPVKPSMPPLFALAIALWLGAAFCYSNAHAVGARMLTLLVVVSLCVTLLAATGWWCSRGHLAWCFVIGLALGVAFGCLGASKTQEEYAWVGSGMEVSEFQLTQDAQTSRFGQRATAIAHGVDVTGVSRSCTVLLYLPSDEGRFLHGDVVRGEATFKALDADSRAYYWNSGVVATANLSSLERIEDDSFVGFIRSMRLDTLDAFESHAGTQAGIMQALVCGYVPTLDEEGAYEDYKTTGLAHIVAVSGSHLTLVAACIESLMRAFGVKRRVRLGMCIFFVCAYLVFSGLPLSALRAAVMTIASLMAFLPKRRSAALNALGLSIVLFIVHDPLAAVSVSFVLSAGATLGIVVLANLFDSWLPSVPRRMHDAFLEPLTLTCASSVTTLPYSAALFSQLSLISPFANVVAVPFFSSGCLCGLFAALVTYVMPETAPVLVPLAALTTMPLSLVVGWLATLPYACICVAADVGWMIALSIVSTAVLWVWWPRFRLRYVIPVLLGVALFVTAYAGITRFVSEDEIVMLDVGQGDAILLRSQGTTMLVDTGTEDALLRRELAKQGVLALDTVLITHPDDDHCGSLEMLGSVVNVRSASVAADTLTCRCDSCEGLMEVVAGLPRSPSVHALEQGDVLQCGVFALTVVWPTAFEDEGGNGDSVCLLVESDIDEDGVVEWRTLLTGDAEAVQLEQITKRYRVGEVDVLKVGHHGSHQAVNAQVLDSLKPRVALISAGEGNRYGHPHEETLGFLEEASCDVFRTDEQGTITVRFRADEMVVITTEHEQLG